METFSFIFSDSRKLLPVEAVFCSTGTYLSTDPSFQLVKRVFCQLETAFFISSFFSANENITEIW